MSFYSLGSALEEVLRCSEVKYILKRPHKVVCPWENTDVCKLIPTCSTDYPWDLLIVIANASLTGNWSLLSGTGNVSALGDNLILGINTTLPLNLLSLLIILYWSIFLLTFNTTILVPLQSPSPGSKFLNKITGEPTLRQSKAGSIELLNVI